VESERKRERGTHQAVGIGGGADRRFYDAFDVHAAAKIFAQLERRRRAAQQVGHRFVVDLCEGHTSGKLGAAGFFHGDATEQVLQHARNQTSSVIALAFNVWGSHHRIGLAAAGLAVREHGSVVTFHAGLDNITPDTHENLLLGGALASHPIVRKDAILSGFQNHGLIKRVHVHASLETLTFTVHGRSHTNRHLNVVFLIAWIHFGVSKMVFV
jgi:hypothetical protein